MEAERERTVIFMTRTGKGGGVYVATAACTSIGGDGGPEPDAGGDRDPGPAGDRGRARALHHPPRRRGLAQRDLLRRLRGRRAGGGRRPPGEVGRGDSEAGVGRR